MLRQSRHTYAAGLRCGLPTDIRNRLRSRPPTGGGRALLTGPHPPDWSRRAAYGALPTGSNLVYTFPSRWPDPDRLAVPTRPGVVGAAPTLTCVPRLGLPPASKTCCDRPTVESFHLHPVHGASWRTRTPPPNDAPARPRGRPERHRRVVRAVNRGTYAQPSPPHIDSDFNLWFDRRVDHHRQARAVVGASTTSSTLAGSVARRSSRTGSASPSGNPRGARRRRVGGWSRGNRCRRASRRGI